jgi:hypothetical protein
MLSLLLACAPVDEGAFQPVPLGTVSASANAIDGSGEIVVEGDATWASAFGFDDGEDPGEVYVVILPALGTTCDEAARFMDGNWDGDAAPDVVMPPGDCTVSFTSSRYSGGLDVEATEGTPTTDAIVSVTCAQADGTWVGEDDEAWTFDGYTYQATSKDFSLGLGGGDGDTYDWTVDASAFEGQFPQSLDYQGIEGTGTVAGEGTAEWCGEFSTLGIFE